MFGHGSFPIRAAVIVVSILMYNNRLIVGGPPPVGYDLVEREALDSLKVAFGNKFIDRNWTGHHCQGDDLSGWFGLKCSYGRVTEIVLENMGLKGTIKSDGFIVFGELLMLSLRNNSLSGLMMNFVGTPKLFQLDLSWNQFHGPVSRSVMNLENLTLLKVQHNKLTGEMPAFDQPSLVTLDVSDNNLSGPIPSTRVLQSFPPESFAKNPRLCGPPTLSSCNDHGPEAEPNLRNQELAYLDAAASPSGSSPENLNSKGSNKITKFVIIFLVFGIVALAAVVLLFILYYKKSHQLKMTEEVKGEDEHAKIERSEKPGCPPTTERYVSSVSVLEDKGRLVFMSEEGGTFGMIDLLKAPVESLRKGIFGNTYKVKMDNRPAVVVKRLRDLKPMTCGEFSKQLGIISSLNHPNLLPPLAYFYSKQEKLLLYRFAEKGNLFNLIHGGRGSKERIPFRWKARLSVARGVARALEYLHIHKQQNDTNSLPHGNLKSTNVLVDENNMILVADYGLYSLVALPIAAQSMVSFRSPEYTSTKRVSHKTDVWSFGCLLLELLTGRICANSAPPGVCGVDLCGWVNRAVREKWMSAIFDVEISVQRNVAHGMQRLLQVAIKCCVKSPEKRPEIIDVVREVEDIMVVVDSEDESDLSIDQSLTEESTSVDLSHNTSVVVSDSSLGGATGAVGDSR